MKKTNRKEPIPIAVDDPLQPRDLLVSVFRQPSEHQQGRPGIWLGEMLLFLGPAAAIFALVLWFLFF